MTGFFQETEGKNSMTRLLTFILVISGVIIALGSVIGSVLGQQVESVNNLSFSLALIGAGLTGKVVQSFGEKK